MSVLENRPENSEIVVVLGFGYHDPWSVGEEVRFIQAPIGSNRVACINLGLAAVSYTHLTLPTNREV